ncbi:MAG: hypothetical protein HY815_00985 [Candidatus Riflebacteria bacterium]|nr:hypothetical protein [Candidatus Riflebacteria bacterium]
MDRFVEFGVHRSVGCEVCEKRGHRGRVGLFELVSPTEGLRTVLHEGKTGPELTREISYGTGMTFRDAALRKALMGTLSLEEVQRLVG